MCVYITYQIKKCVFMCVYITYQIKKCVYIIKKACVFMCVYGVILINILVLQLGPPKQKFLAPPLGLSLCSDFSFFG